MKKRHVFGIILLALFFTAAFTCLVFYTKLNLINRVDLDSGKVQISEVFKPQADKTPATGQQKEDTANTEDDNPYTGFEIIALVGLDTRDASALANSDTMIFACINHDERNVRLFSLYRDTLLNIGEDSYKKANAAYCTGGPEKFLSMVNMNLDLNVTRFVTTNFNALAEAIDIIGGLDLDLTREELIHMNNYNVETSKVCGVEYKEVPVPDDENFDGVNTRTFHLTGTQAVSYARIRYTTGWDYKRTERQRILLSKIREKVIKAGFPTMLKICTAVFPQITTNLENDEILSMVRYCISYDIIGSEGFPFEKQGMDVDGMDAVVPVSLEENVKKLHEYIYPGLSYTPSEIVKSYSSIIESKANGTYQTTAIQETGLEDAGWQEQMAPAEPEQVPQPEIPASPEQQAPPAELPPENSGEIPGDVPSDVPADEPSFEPEIPQEPAPPAPEIPVEPGVAPQDVEAFADSDSFGV